ncbi:Na/Pi cotransporter family protein [Puniceicoccaceae bacterium K14]|nr:Na/Pi cotransporter family protein [Puniceicoccaceae bacterium K14]
MPDYLYLLLQLLGSLGIFIFGMKMMSESILELSGDRLRSILGSMTTNRYTGILTGFLITCLVQSSSATTVMVVSFAHAGLLSLVQSVGVIMGANLGTTITAWIVTLFGFKLKLTAFAIPAIGIGVALSFTKKVSRRALGNFMAGFGFLFLGLGELKNAVPDVKSNPEVMEFVTNLSGYGFGSLILFIFIGTLLTVTVQSSSAAMAITFTMANQGWLNFEQSAAIILGENIGTTLTAFLASIPANTSAKRAARAHLLFNIIGVIWMIILIVPFSNFIHWLYDASLNFLPWEKFESNTDLTNKLALFHSMFNFINILVLVSFVPQIARLAILTTKKAESNPNAKTYHYLKVHSVGIGELNFQEAKGAIGRLGSLSHEMFNKFLYLYEHHEEDLSKNVKELNAMEEEANGLTDELTDYLISCSSDKMADSTRTLASSYIRVVNELEEICDCCHRLTTRAVKRYRRDRYEPKRSEEDVIQFGETVNRFIDFYRSKLESEVSAQDMEISLDFEKLINSKRKNLRRRSVNRMIKSQDSIKAELIHFDIVNTFERIANHSQNIIESLPHAD